MLHYDSSKFYEEIHKMLLLFSIMIERKKAIELREQLDKTRILDYLLNFHSKFDADLQFGQNERTSE